MATHNRKIEAHELAMEPAQEMLSTLVAGAIDPPIDATPVVSRCHIVGSLGGRVGRPNHDLDIVVEVAFPDAVDTAFEELSAAHRGQLADAIRRTERGVERCLNVAYDRRVDCKGVIPSERVLSFVDPRADTYDDYLAAALDRYPSVYDALDGSYVHFPPKM